VMLEDLAGRAWEIEVPWEGPGPGRGGAVLVDRLLVRVARGHGAVDVALGECLAAMDSGDRALRLGYAGIADYAREVLGIAGRTALALARLARELADRPVLRAAVRRGEVSPRLAQELLPVAKGEAEAAWVARAGQLTVREAIRAVRAAMGGRVAPALADEGWSRVERPPSLFRRFQFASYSETRAFLDRLAALSEETDLYPDLGFATKHVNVTIRATGGGPLGAREAEFASRAAELAEEGAP